MSANKRRHAFKCESNLSIASTFVKYRTDGWHHIEWTGPHSRNVPQRTPFLVVFIDRFNRVGRCWEHFFWSVCHYFSSVQLTGSKIFEKEITWKRIWRYKKVVKMPGDPFYYDALLRWRRWRRRRQNNFSFGGWNDVQYAKSIGEGGHEYTRDVKVYHRNKRTLRCDD